MPIRDEDLATIATWRDGDTATRREAGRAIARVLRGEPLSMSYRRMLADLFDPPGMDKPDFAHGSHRVRLKTGRKKKVKDGRPPKAGPRLAAAVYRYIQVGHRKKRAYSYAAKELGVGYRTAEKAFAQYAKPLLQYVSRLNMPNRTVDICFLHD